MKQLLLLGALLMLPQLLAAAVGNAQLLHYEPDLSDLRSLQRGARLFVNYCMGCHSAKFMRYERLGEDLAIPEEMLRENLMFGTDKPGDTMDVVMRRADAEQWFGVAPPDLTLTARARGADWLYSYLLGFYLDETRPTGVNNLVFKEVAMPHVLWELQGFKRPVYREITDESGVRSRVIERLETQVPGKLDDVQYAAVVRDLVNFMTYLSEPVKTDRIRIGAWVLVYLIFLLIVLYLLKQEYWKDVK